MSASCFINLVTLGKKKVREERAMYVCHMPPGIKGSQNFYFTRTGSYMQDYIYAHSSWPVDSKAQITWSCIV